LLNFNKLKLNSMKKGLLTKTMWAVAIAISGFSGAQAQGIISTIVGTGTSGTGGDGGPATSATLSYPAGVAVNNAGDIFVVHGSSVRKISGTSGTISSLSTSGALLSAAGVWVNNAGNLFVTDHYHDQVFRVNATSGATAWACGNGHQGHGGDGGPATNGTLMVPAGACTDRAGNIYIADRGSNAIRKVSSPSGTLSTICGNGTAGFSGDGGPASAAMVSSPNGICVDTASNIYFSDMGNQRIRKINAATGRITTIAGTGSAGFSGDGGLAVAAKISGPAALFADKLGNIYLADQGNNRVRKIAVSRVITTIAGTGTAGFSGDGGPATSAKLSSPSGVWVDAWGNVFISDMYNNRIRKITNFVPTPKANGVSGVDESSVLVFPNPSTGTFYLQADASLLNATFEVYNVAGAKVYQSVITGTQDELVLDQPAGVYFLVVATESGKITKRVVISK
jgi:sugar lactone lactonase YvrE